MNKSQAYKVLDEAGLDGLVAFNPVNIFYLGNFVAFNVKIQTREPSFAVFPRDEKKPTILVVGSTDLWQISNGLRETAQIIPYSAATNWHDFVGQESVDTGLEAAPGLTSILQINEAGLTPRELDWIGIEKRFEGQFMPTPQHALVMALKEAGLDHAKVAVDDLRLTEILKSAGHYTTQCVDGDNIFRKIRVVKSDVEVRHMRCIAAVNQQAAMNMIQQLDVGASNADIDQLFAIEAAKLGAKATWLAAGSVGGLTNGEIIKNQPILVDAVSEINYYHGDFGRTVVAGEPSKELLERTKLLQIGWQAALEIMRPGVRYSEIEKAARFAMKSSGLKMPPLIVVPHSVGLQHTDEPYRDNLPFQVKDDLILEENMTLTVDFPSLEMGWGNCHLEDLVRITKDGVEALATIDSPLVVI
ncbi:M24 family metallopeptidase [Aliiglaciecola sp. 3_MG-2023]|uniref:M24 family metallopeptidase n=1 Tax=Aliiglaciecola sp. 3_MG-2023 TaxID=3062644 RepID=UPI0026E21C5D|nr:M24 family metallopeptidase [Aliiglaciecola sp. 3_MG-2023]MDO6693056.1 M24 family metallopeptidase [Aliiglaciecola sp. 3_MG-2023]